MINELINDWPKKEEDELTKGRERLIDSILVQRFKKNKWGPVVTCVSNTSVVAAVVFVLAVGMGLPPLMASRVKKAKKKHKRRDGHRRKHLSSRTKLKKTPFKKK